MCVYRSAISGRRFRELLHIFEFWGEFPGGNRRKTIKQIQVCTFLHRLEMGAQSVHGCVGSAMSVDLRYILGADFVNFCISFEVLERISQGKPWENHQKSSSLHFLHHLEMAAQSVALSGRQFCVLLLRLYWAPIS